MLRIKELCKLSGITITQLAERVGMMQPSLSRIIKGGNTTTSTLEMIADALSVPMSELFEQPTKDTINCPNCGIKLKLEKD